MKLSEDIILFHISKYINDTTTFSRLLRLNKSIYKKSENSIYYGKFIINDIRIIKAIPVKRQIYHLKVIVNGIDKGDKLDLRYYSNLGTLNVICNPEFNSVHVAGNITENKLEIIYPPNLVEFSIANIRFDIDKIPDKIKRLRLHGNIDVSEDMLGRFKNLETLILNETRFQSEKLEKIKDLKNLECICIYYHNRNITKFPELLFPPKLKELYISSNIDGISLHQLPDTLEVLMIDCRGVCELKNVPKSLKVVIEGNNYITFKEHKPKLYLELYSYEKAYPPLHDIVDSVFVVVRNKRNYYINGHPYYVELCINKCNDRKSYLTIFEDENGLGEEWVLMYKHDADIYRGLKELKKYEILRINHNAYKTIEECIKK